MKFSKYIFKILLFGGIAFLIIEFTIIFSKLRKDINYDLPSTYSISKESSFLISQKYLSSLKVNEVVRDKVRNPVSMLILDSLYHLIIFEINLLNESSLKNILHLERAYSRPSTGESYRIMGNEFLTIKYKSGFQTPASQILLTLSSDSLVKIKDGDNLLCYHLVCKNLSLKYAGLSAIDIYAESTKQPVSMDLLLKQKGKLLYLILLTPAGSLQSVPGNLLSKVIVDD